MRFTVTVEVEVDLDAWQVEYGVDAHEALSQVLNDLRKPGYFDQPKWTGLASVQRVRAALAPTAGGLRRTR